MVIITIQNILFIDKLMKLVPPEKSICLYMDFNCETIDGIVRVLDYGGVTLGVYNKDAFEKMEVLEDILDEFLDADMAGANFSEADLSDSDLSTSENLDSCRFDESTIWPDLDKLPEDFDSTYNYDLSTLRDDEENGNEDY